ncbi:hypothetical protein [Nocardioides mesophilus]|uniref:Multicopper oxidase domain-containing protein n=1 Tax=Nocardioides mesophilus TaxID=433659 RepID=A0A7G9R7K1_9ACTN|nr:hypothetical protein [Nocardioides mesophilus]QNN51576.1 hypothetical protein H9L09_13445 [Nocardioides mesophilus]
MDQGDTVTVTLHNTLGVKTALFFQGQQLPLDRTGADASTGTRTYTFTASHPGTFLYEAGPVLKSGPADTAGTGTQYQTAMGLHGALVVRPAPGQAYDAGSAYDDEAVLVLSEIDPALNTKASPATFDMRRYVPRYSLINGKAYPDTTAIPSAGGHTVLLRYVNAGVNYHSMGVLGASQTVVGTDGNKLDFPRTYVAQTFGPRRVRRRPGQGSGCRSPGHQPERLRGEPGTDQPHRGPRGRHAHHGRRAGLGGHR